MFEKIIADLKQGRLPSDHQLKKWFDAALIKKLGVLKQPYLLWQSDPKINPSAAHLLWAAILLEDPEGLQAVKAVIATEMCERRNYETGQSSRDELRSALETDITKLLDEFVGFAPDETFALKLQRKVARVCFGEQSDEG